MTSSKQLSVFSILLFCVAVQAEIRLGNKCPAFETVKEFDAAEYVGKWYEYAKYPTIFEAGGKCITATYGLMENGDVSVDNRQFSSFTNKPKSIEGYATVAGPGKLLVTFPSLPSFAGAAPYNVLDTDYKNYAAVYSCTKILGVIINESAWILTRTPNPSEETLALAKQAFTKNGISVDNFKVTDQTNCSN